MRTGSTSLGYLTRLQCVLGADELLSLLVQDSRQSWDHGAAGSEKETYLELLKQIVVLAILMLRTPVHIFTNETHTQACFTPNRLWKTGHKSRLSYTD